MNASNVGRELKGLRMGMQGVGADEGVLICESVQTGVEIPSWCRVKEAWRWGLDVFDMIRGKTQL